MSDGLVVPFALIAGMSNTALSNTAIGFAGCVAVLAGAIVMSIAAFLTVRNKDAGHEHHIDGLGIDNEVKKRIEEEHQPGKQPLSIYEQQMPAPAHAKSHAINAGIGYLAGGIIPVIPYFITTNPTPALKLAFGVTIIALLTFGFLKARFTGLNPYWGALRAAFLGTVTAVACYFIAGLLAS